ncbi:hypothetical protein BDV96DRAFT_578139 [Lophiotrema nucula]|uniref:Uncharacterized protein n=1 Tax=Lophiotrema nucula TaxID=690887 RepID=A0A6A5Z5D5_9PLEO|nr:hypothetical protein BDV96DRAFT_578139 [Lophiotrema nucula]
MAPKAAANTPKKRGRPAKNAVASPAPAPVAEPNKRGRAATAKVEVPTPEPMVELPKKRGRAPKAAKVDAPAQTDEPATKRRGRPPKDAAPVVDDDPITPQKSGRGRPARGSKAAAKAPVASGVIGSPRVSKRTSPRRRPATAAPPPPPRINARMRSKLRTRAPPTKAAAPVVLASPVRKKKGKIGRPRKDAATAPATKTGAVKSGRVEKPAAQPAARRHRAAKGMTTLEVPKKLLPQIKRYIQDLEEAQAQAEEGARQQALENEIVRDADNNDDEEVIEDEEEIIVEEVDEEMGDDALEGAQEEELQDAALNGETTAVVEITEDEARGMGVSAAPTELPTELEREAQRELQGAIDEFATGSSGVLGALGSARTSPDVEFNFDAFQETATEAHVSIAAGM